MRYHVINSWKTPASDYPHIKLGDWSITTRRQAEGIYKMQDIGSFYYVPNVIDLTVLSQGNKVWFTDEPRQMYAMAEIGLFRAEGNVVVGGLGLGLIHSFLKHNPMVTSITTIEIAPELEKLVWPYVNVGKLIIGDFYKVLPQLNEPIDTIYTDFIFGNIDDKTWEELNVQREFCTRYFPNAQFLEHGYQAYMDEEVVNKAIPPTGTMYDKVVIVR